MSSGAQDIIPHSIDLSALVRKSVASLYSHLVTRPTGQALRMGIESQISELGNFCVSVLDFTQVVILDYSCADETIAKLILRYQRDDRPSDAYFVARGVAEHHIEPIEDVLSRQDLALVADIDGMGFMLLGEASESERAVWGALHSQGFCNMEKIQASTALHGAELEYAVDRLMRRRAVIRRDDVYVSLSALVA